MENNKFTSFKYVVRNNLKHEDKVIVQVFFMYSYKNVVRTIELNKKVEGEAYYINEAKKIINQEITSGKLVKFAKHYGARTVSKKILKVALASVISLGVVGSAAYGAYHIINNIQTRDSVVTKVVNQIKSLNENSTLDEINEAIKAYEDLPDYLKTSVPKDTRDYLDQQVALYKVDRTAADAVDAFTAPFTLEDTTETLVKEAETKIDALTQRGHTLIREGTEEFLDDIKEAIEVDKAKAKAINDAVEALNPDTIYAEEVLKIVTDTIALSNRAYSYIKEESVQKISYLIEYWEISAEILAYIMPIVEEYTTEATLCTMEDIITLENVYNDYFTTSVKEFVDDPPYYFSDKIETAKALWTRDDTTATTLANLAKALNPATCLNADIKVVTDKEAELKAVYPNNKFNQRTLNYLKARGYDEALKSAKDALAADILATQNFYNQEKPIIHDNCSQADIDKVRADFNNYLTTASERLTYLISNDTEECSCNLKSAIEAAQQLYNDDLNEAKTKYNDWCKLLTPSSSETDITNVINAYNTYKAAAKARIKGFLAKGGQYDIETKIEEAQELYEKDVAMAHDFDLAVDSLPTNYVTLSTEQKMIMASANEYLNKKADSKHIYLSNRAKTLVDSDLKDKLGTLITEAGDNFKLTLEPKLNDDEYSFFTSDNIVKFDPTVGLYVEITYVKNDSEYENPRFTKVMGSAWSSDYPRVFDPNNYNHVISCVYVPSGVSSNLKIEGVRYIAESIYDESFINLTPSYDNFLTIDIEINHDYHFMEGKYNGYTIGIKNQKDSDIGKVFKVSGHYSEMR